MAALIGLVVGALAGHALWGEWGAKLGGFAGFLVGAIMMGRCQRAAHRKPNAFAASPGATNVARDQALAERIATLEARVAELERNYGGAAQPGPSRRGLVASPQRALS